ncbi:hypothetical protein D3A56_0017 [Klebsiella phage Kund-ULIP47]|uniref:Uncharacterized protein n=1 Tax=Klebsiella phage Kund-ULIP47 TaxID=2307016 RepID=A0A4P6DBK4_9CAUD|nr:hypothetical protein D3A56_0017 [Klebsiella phage Kund-ULIP47]
MNKFKEHFDPIPFLAYGLLGLWVLSFVGSFVISYINGTSL